MRSTSRSLALGITVVALFFVATYNIAHACEIAILPIKERLERADAVFLGKLIVSTDGAPGAVNDGPCGYHPTRFEVLSSWKGVTSKQITVTTRYGCQIQPDCSLIDDPNYSLAQTYLVYARLGVDGNLYTTFSVDDLLFSIPLDDAQTDLKVLGPGKSPVDEIGMPRSGNSTEGSHVAMIIGLIALISGLWVKRHN